MKPLIGAHLSTAGGFHKALQSAIAIEANCLQIFTKSNRQWCAKPLDNEQVAIFKKHREKLNINNIFAHASYLINVASDNLDISTKSTQALTEELIRCDTLDIKHLVLHPGNNGQTAKEESLKRVALNINTALQESQNTSVLLENMAGQGSSIAHNFENIAYICSLIEDKERVGICFDTCHAFAAGYDLNNNYGEVWRLFEKTIGIEKLKLIHLNDSKKPLGSKVDRHEKIGKGQINLSVFQKIMTDPRLQVVPKVLETPTIETELEYKEELDLLKSL